MSDKVIAFKFLRWPMLETKRQTTFVLYAESKSESCMLRIKAKELSVARYISNGFSPRQNRPGTAKHQKKAKA
ncbi:hypothetical protein AD933_03000 [Acetobacter malorum]|uniref:Uncharacterized protein n=2 Tax=Acetobacter TaxID=434 RepID=A0A149RW53_9PROT|nr:hypothetical protein AD933_03000 [Acetobacter malorum]KXV69710.1 hypothetical protein AD951_05400 [Acetobacter malorum]KXV70617.1 hypothetical protein AD952_12355 [Acetobacter cerevisiae]KXV74690.1 hypothetical protein AD953_10545 [Acetobacter malorum]